MNSIFKDRRASSLLNRVRGDITNLREDIGDLLTHTTHNTLPSGARELADQARSQLAAGGAYAVSRYRNFRGRPAYNQAGWVGGAVAVGLLALGAYVLCRGCCSAEEEAEDFEEDL